MTGKEKCELLKKLRSEVAEVNGIGYHPTECNFQGECRGYCEKCDADARYLESELERLQSEGKAVIIPERYTDVAPFDGDDIAFIDDGTEGEFLPDTESPSEKIEEWRKLRLPSGDFDTMGIIIPPEIRALKDKVSPDSPELLGDIVPDDSFFDDGDDL